MARRSRGRRPIWRVREIEVDVVVVVLGWRCAVVLTVKTVWGDMRVTCFPKSAKPRKSAAIGTKTLTFDMAQAPVSYLSTSLANVTLRRESRPPRHARRNPQHSTPTKSPLILKCCVLEQPASAATASLLEKSFIMSVGYDAPAKFNACYPAHFSESRMCLLQSPLALPFGTSSTDAHRSESRSIMSMFDRKRRPG